MRGTWAMVMVVAAAGVAAGQAGGIDMAAVQKWNAAKVVRYHITGVYKAKTPPMTMAVPSPVMLSLPVNADPKFAVSADKKSFVFKTPDGWTWTYTPTVVQ